MVQDHVLLLFTPKEWAEYLFECQSIETSRTYCITSVGFDSQPNDFGVLCNRDVAWIWRRVGSFVFVWEDGENEAAGLISTKLSCCYKIDGRREAE